MSYLVVIGNMAKIVGPFESSKEARTWADTAQLTDRYRHYSTTLVELTPPSPFAFKVEVEIENIEEDADGEPFTEVFVVAANSHEGAENIALGKAREKYSEQFAATYKVTDSRVRT